MFIFSEQTDYILPLIQYKKTVSANGTNYTVYQYGLGERENEEDWDFITDNNKEDKEVSHVLVANR